VKKDGEREKRLAAALRENLKRRKAQARECLPGSVSATAGGGPVAEGPQPETEEEAGPVHHAAHGPPPRSGED